MLYELTVILSFCPLLYQVSTIGKFPLQFHLIDLQHLRFRTAPTPKVPNANTLNTEEDSGTLSDTVDG